MKITIIKVAPVSAENMRGLSPIRIAINANNIQYLTVHVSSSTALIPATPAPIVEIATTTAIYGLEGKVLTKLF